MRHLQSYEAACFSVQRLAAGGGGRYHKFQEDRRVEGRAVVVRASERRQKPIEYHPDLTVLRAEVHQSPWAPLPPWLSPPAGNWARRPSPLRFAGSVCSSATCWSTSP